MTYRIPYLSVLGPDGTDQVKVWGSKLIGVKIVTRFTDEHDECTFMFTNKPPYVDAPGENTPFTVKIGWSAATAVLGGIYYMSRIHLTGDPKQGEQVQYVCRSGLTADLEQAQSRHFNAENGNNSLGDFFRNLFGSFGVPVEVAASIAGKPLPGGHLLQWQQSNIDFGTEIANSVGAIVKPSGGKILVLDRNGGQSVSGKDLVRITIVKTPGYQYDVEVEPRFQYQSVSASYLDDDAGRLKTESSADQGSTGAKDALPHPAADQASAAIQAKARADEYKRFSGTGLFMMPGEPNAVAGAPCDCTGFPSPIDTIPWIAAEVTHDVTPGQGWVTTVETETDAA